MKFWPEVRLVRPCIEVGRFRFYLFLTDCHEVFSTKHILTYVTNC